MKIKIAGFSAGAYGNLGEQIYILVAGGDDVILQTGDVIEITRPTKDAPGLGESAASDSES